MPTSSWPYLDFGDQYLAAAFKLARDGGVELMSATPQMYGLGLELILKAYLVHSGDAPLFLWQEFGHHVGDLLDRALGMGLATWGPVLAHPLAREVVHEFSEVYAGEKAGPSRHHHHFIYPHRDAKAEYFSSDNVAVARATLRAVARATDHKGGRLLALDEWQPIGTLAELLHVTTSGPFAGH